MLFNLCLVFVHNTGNMPVEMPNIETRYFKLPF